MLSEFRNVSDKSVRIDGGLGNRHKFVLSKCSCASASQPLGVNYPDRYRTTGLPRTVDRLGFCRNHFARPVGLRSPTYCRRPSASPAAMNLLAADSMSSQRRLTVAFPESRQRRPRLAGIARWLLLRVALSFLHLFVINGLRERESDSELGKAEQRFRPFSRKGRRVLSSHVSRAVRPCLASPEKYVALWIYPARSGTFCTALYLCVGRAAVCFHPRTRVRALCCGTFLRCRLRGLLCVLRMRNTGHDKQGDSGCDYQW